MNQLAKIPTSLKSALLEVPHKELEEILLSLSEAFQNADTWCKRVEVICGMLPIPPVNQMRYAGYHISRFLNNSEIFSTDQKSNINIDDLRAAYNHLLRAYYDSLDYMTQQLLAEMNIFEQNFSELNLVPTDHFSDFYNWKRQISQIEQFKVFVDDSEIQTTARINEFALNSNDRKAHYARIVEKINELEHIKNQFEAIGVCITTQAVNITKEKKRDDIIKYSLIVMILGLIAAIAIPLYLDYKNSPLTSQLDTTKVSN
ncbi:hypothetical protein [Acinetobacter sp. XH1639]|uniref:hypothetical protein n=1 Tax=Acinetobacter sp. XH1639 TaxID=3157368 RepID=UPI0032B4C325